MSASTLHMAVSSEMSDIEQMRSDSSLNFMLSIDEVSWYFCFAIGYLGSCLSIHRITASMMQSGINIISPDAVMGANLQSFDTLRKFYDVIFRTLSLFGIGLN